MTRSLKNTKSYTYGRSFWVRVVILQCYWIMPNYSLKVIIPTCYIIVPYLQLCYLPFKHAVLMGAKWYLTEVLSYISISTSDTGNCVLWLSAIWVSLSVACSISVSFLFFWFVVFFFLLCYSCIFYFYYQMEEWRFFSVDLFLQFVHISFLNRLVLMSSYLSIFSFVVSA